MAAGVIMTPMATAWARSAGASPVITQRRAAFVAES